ncbi:MAG: PP0621 family protein [Thiobacillus sp.]
MGKILLLIIIGLVVYAMIRNYQRSLNKPSGTSREQTVEDMVKCAHCGVNLPRSEAIYSGGEFFCTPEHKQLGRK